MKKAIVTGGHGYIGRHLCARLYARGWQIVLVDRPRTGEALSTPHELVEYDGTPASLHVMKTSTEDEFVVFHLAARSASDAKMLKDVDSLQANLTFGIHLVAFMAARSLRNMVFAESYWSFDAEGQVHPNSLYAATKSALAQILEYCANSRLCVASLVLYDVYGPDDPRDKLIPALLDSFRNGTTLPLTAGEQIVDFVHVDDVTAAFEAASMHLSKSLSPGFWRFTVRSLEALSLREHVERIAAETDLKANIQWGARPYPPHQIMKPWLPADVAQVPGWRPQVSLPPAFREMLQHGPSKRTYGLHS